MLLRMLVSRKITHVPTRSLRESRCSGEVLGCLGRLVEVFSPVLRLFTPTPLVLATSAETQSPKV